MTRLVAPLLFLVTFHAFAQAPTADLVAYYTASGNLVDSSSAGNDATAIDISYHADQHGRPRGAFNFNGLTSQIIGPVRRTNQIGLTVSAMMRPSGLQNIDFFYIGNPASNGYGLRFAEPGTPSTPGSYVVFLQGGVSESTNADSNIYEPDTWQHMVLVKDGGTLRYYRNGRQLGMTSTNQTFTTSHIYIGSDPTGQQSLGDSYYGLMDNVRIYDRALSPAEIQQLYIADTSATITDVKPIQVEDVRIYPTVVDNSLTVNLPSSSMGAVAQIFDVMGRLVLESKVAYPNAELDLSLLPAGNYQVRLQMANQVKVVRISKQ